MAGTLLSLAPDRLQGGTTSLSMMKLKVPRSYLWLFPPGHPGSAIRCGLASTQLVAVRFPLTAHSSGSVVPSGFGAHSEPQTSSAPRPHFERLLESSPSVHIECTLEYRASMVFCPSSYCTLFRSTFSFLYDHLS